jgi:hypothetical protein
MIQQGIGISIEQLMLKDAPYVKSIPVVSLTGLDCTETVEAIYQVIVKSDEGNLEKKIMTVKYKVGISFLNPIGSISLSN